MCMFVKADKCCLVYSLEKGVRGIPLFLAAEFILLLVFQLGVFKSLLGMAIALGLKFLLLMTAGSSFMCNAEEKTTQKDDWPQIKKKDRRMVFIGFIVEVFLQFIVVMALLVVISYNYS